MSKRYTLGKRDVGAPQYDTLREALVRSVIAPFRRRDSSSKAARDEEFWALKDVSFEIDQGEVIGIIGRNGAGKSTLLKILNRITEPTAGRVSVRGRLASLLEVGTGFHPELTGRENIFLNGVILGMTRAEVRRRFDEIVAFAEVERFLDTPVKHYSSGMYVRLAFSVAAHLDPDILIVDEVLAVGDTQFQKKCLGKMEEVAQTSGRTVLFVSHNLDAISQLCPSSILLEAGRVSGFGPTEEILPLSLENQNRQFFVSSVDKRHGILSVVTVSPNASSRDLVFKVTFASPELLETPTLGAVVYSMRDVPLFGTNTLFHPWRSEPRFNTTGSATLTIRDAPLWTGTYKASFWLSDGTQRVDAVLDAVTFEIISAHLPLNAPPVKDIGSIHVRGEWQPFA